MGKNRLLLIPLVMFFLLACGLGAGIQQLQQVASQIPGMLTSLPTSMGGMETAAAISSNSNCGTSTPGGLGISLAQGEAILVATQQVTFASSTVNGKPVATATLSSTGASAFPSLSSSFSAQFIGNPCNLDEILVTAPRTDQQSTVDEGIGVMNVIFAAILPPTVELPLLTWLSDNYAKVPVSGQEQTTILNMQFTLKRSADNVMTLDILPTQ